MANPDDGQFCRRCGCDLGSVADAISGKFAASRDAIKKKDKKPPKWEEILPLLFISVAFFTVSFFLAFQPMAQFWWFWLLIPAFATLATGIGKALDRKHQMAIGAALDSGEKDSLSTPAVNSALPPQQTEYVPAQTFGDRQTRDLAPTSVVEDTTRNLEITTEREPKKQKNDA